MVQKTIEIMSFGAAPMIAPAGPVHTVPRKRRPRAAGEVFITSHSNVYFVDPKDVSLLPPESTTTNKEPVSDPIYQNTVDEIETAKSQRSKVNLEKNGREKVRKRYSFCSVRVSTCTSETSETQQVSAFIGKIYG